MDELAEIPKAAPTLRRMLTHNIELLEQLYALNPKDTTACEKSRQSRSHRQCSDELLRRLPGRLGRLSRVLKIRRQLALNDPDSSQAQRDLTVSLNKLGDINLQLGNSQAAADAGKSANSLLTTPIPLRLSAI